MKTVSLSLDFETYYNTKIGYGISELGAERYCRDDRFDPYLLAVCDGANCWAGPPNHFNWDTLEESADKEVRLVAHNAGFDKTVQKEMARRNWAPVLKNRWYCTANMSSFLCNRRSLADACDCLLGVTLDKSVRNDANGKTSAELRADVAGWERMLSYGRSDAFRCWELWDKFSPKWPEHERLLSELTIEQGMRGVHIDRALLLEYSRVVDSMLLAAEFGLPWVAAGRPPTSPKAMAEECRKVGIPCPPVKSREGVDAFDEWEATYSARCPWIKAVSDWRQINKLKATLETIRTRIKDDDILPFGLKYFGAHTGRWSGDAGLNFQNFRKVPLYATETCVLTEVKKEAKYTLDVRRLITPRPGKKLIVSDLSQIEPRVTAWLAGDKVALEAMANGDSPYVAHAKASMGWNPTHLSWVMDDLKNECPKLYQLAKVRILGLGYGAGWKKLITMAKSMVQLDITIGDPEFEQKLTRDGELCWNADGTPKMVSGYGANARRIVKDFRDSNPGIVNLWRKLDDGFKNAVGGDFVMTLPSGRTMTYPNVTSEWRTTTDEDGKLIRKLCFLADVGGRRTVLYGGLLFENLVQATARDVFAEHVLTLNATPGIEVLFTVHDEAVCECEEHITKADVQAIMSITPSWLRGCPVSADTKEVSCYEK